MQDCSNCTNAIETGDNHACKIGNNTYLISDYPNSGINCAAWQQGKQQKQTKKSNNDPLITWLGKFKKKKPQQETKSAPVVDDEETKALKYFDEHAKEIGIETKETKPIIPNYTDLKINGNEVIDGNEVNIKNALGWVVSAILGGVIISIWLLGLL